MNFYAASRFSLFVRGKLMVNRDQGKLGGANGDEQWWIRTNCENNEFQGDEEKHRGGCCEVKAADKSVDFSCLVRYARLFQEDINKNEKYRDIENGRFYVYPYE